MKTLQPTAAFPDQPHQYKSRVTFNIEHTENRQNQSPLRHIYQQGRARPDQEFQSICEEAIDSNLSVVDYMIQQNTFKNAGSCLYPQGFEHLANLAKLDRDATRANQAFNQFYRDPTPQPKDDSTPSP